MHQFDNHYLLITFRFEAILAVRKQILRFISGCMKRLLNAWTITMKSSVVYINSAIFIYSAKFAELPFGATRRLNIEKRKMKEIISNSKYKCTLFSHSNSLTHSPCPLSLSLSLNIVGVPCWHLLPGRIQKPSIVIAVQWTKDDDNNVFIYVQLKIIWFVFTLPYGFKFKLPRRLEL